jgi:hypothetical protein
MWVLRRAARLGTSQAFGAELSFWRRSFVISSRSGMPYMEHPHSDSVVLAFINVPRSADRRNFGVGQDASAGERHLCPNQGPRLTAIICRPCA